MSSHSFCMSSLEGAGYQCKYIHLPSQRKKRSLAHPMSSMRTVVSPVPPRVRDGKKISKMYDILPPWSLTWPPKSDLPKKKFIFQPSFFRGYVKLPGSISNYLFFAIPNNGWVSISIMFLIVWSLGKEGPRKQISVRALVDFFWGDSYSHGILGGAFKYMLVFIPAWGDDPIWKIYVSNGLV